MEVDRRAFIEALGAAALGLMTPEELQAYELIQSPSPKRRTRANRKDTEFIVLHTTEANGSSSLNSLTRYGKASYVVDTDGKVYQIMKPDQISIGCGRSMWKGTTNLDEHAVNIEVVGYHHRTPTGRQIDSIREFLADLQRRYKVSDENVLPHSQVAYGRPNEWFGRSHRGRKRCGMLFATDKLREELGLTKKPSYDPDVSNGKLVIADNYLAGVIYGSSLGRIAAGPVKPPAVIAGPEPAPIPSSEDDDVTVRTIEKGQTLWSYAGNEFDDATTIYMLTDGKIRRGDELKRQKFGFDKIPPGTRVAVGYTYGGHVKPGRSAYSVVGKNWNMPSTLYIYNGSVVTGDQMDDAAIPKGALVLFRK